MKTQTFLNSSMLANTYFSKFKNKGFKKKLAELLASYEGYLSLEKTEVLSKK